MVPKATAATASMFFKLFSPYMTTFFPASVVAESRASPTSSGDKLRGMPPCLNLKAVAANIRCLDV